MASDVILISGNICSGKSTLLKYLTERMECDGFPEFIDDLALDVFYHDPHKSSSIFEQSCLSSRQVRHLKAYFSKKRAIFDRGMVEGAETFAKNSLEQGYLNQQSYQRYLQSLKEGFEHLGLDQQERWLEKLIVYLKVSNVKLLQERQEKRNTPGEIISLDYFQRINDRYDHFIKHKDQIYRKYGLKPPQVLIVNAEEDMNHNDQYHASILEKIVDKLEEMK